MKLQKKGVLNLEKQTVSLLSNNDSLPNGNAVITLCTLSLQSFESCTKSQ